MSLSPHFPLFNIGQAASSFEACQCRILEIRQEAHDQIEAHVYWSLDPELKHVTIRYIQHHPNEWPMIRIVQYNLETGEKYDSYEGCYVPEVIGRLCRIWATG
jgi:hypothetical protein